MRIVYYVAATTVHTHSVVNTGQFTSKNEATIFHHGGLAVGVGCDRRVLRQNKCQRINYRDRIGARVGGHRIEMERPIIMLGRDSIP